MTRSPELGAEKVIPCLQELISTFGDQAFEPIEFVWCETETSSEPDRFKPELRSHFVTIHMDVRTLGQIMTYKIEPIWSSQADGGQARSYLRSCHSTEMSFSPKSQARIAANEKALPKLHGADQSAQARREVEWEFPEGGRRVAPDPAMRCYAL